MPESRAKGAEIENFHITAQKWTGLFVASVAGAASQIRPADAKIAEAKMA